MDANYTIDNKKRDTIVSNGQDVYTLPALIKKELNVYGFVSQMYGFVKASSSSKQPRIVRVQKTFSRTQFIDENDVNPLVFCWRKY